MTETRNSDHAALLEEISSVVDRNVRRSLTDLLMNSLANVVVNSVRQAADPLAVRKTVKSRVWVSREVYSCCGQRKECLSLPTASLAAFVVVEIHQHSSFTNRGSMQMITVLKLVIPYDAICGAIWYAQNIPWHIRLSLAYVLKGLSSKLAQSRAADCDGGSYGCTNWSAGQRPIPGVC